MENKQKVISIVGARPQFIKLAPLSKQLRTVFHEIIVNTGQHFDANMSQVFFDDMKIPKPDYDLGVSTGSHAVQTAKVMTELEPILLKESPRFVLVFGDTNTTLAATLVAAKLHIPVVHIEAGLRSFDRRMPEEQNRIVADHLATVLACPTQVAMDHLKHEGITKGVYLTGDLMFDAVQFFRGLFETRALPVEVANYSVLTLHRPSNVDNKEQLYKIFDCIQSMDQTFVLPIHPRTKKNIDNYSIKIPNNILVIEPLGYLDMMALMNRSDSVFTDSGGLQKEAFFLNKKCVTLRDTTEWVETIALGGNILALDQDGNINAKKILQFLDAPFTNSHDYSPYGEGNAADVILEHCERDFL